MRRDLLLVTLLWVVLTVVGEVVAVSWDFQPLKASKEADIVDEAFFVLLVMSVPICAFVLSMVVYSAFRFRRRKGEKEDGPPIHSNNRVLVAWFAITTALTILVIVYPGTIGLLDLRDHSHSSSGTARASGSQHMVVEVEGSQFLQLG